MKITTPKSNIMKYLIDIYRDGSQWAGFAKADTLEDAQKLILKKFPGAEESSGVGYRQEDANEEGDATLVMGYTIDSTDYADIYEVE